MPQSTTRLPGLGELDSAYAGDLLDMPDALDGRFVVGRDGVRRILMPRDKRARFVVFADKTLTVIESGVGLPAIYPLLDGCFEPPARAVLMDLDGTSVHSEHFWIWIIQQSIARLTNNPRFELSAADEPHVSGHSVSEHLQYCINKYAPGASLERAREHYYAITDYEMAEIAAGRGRADAFTPSAGLKEFLLELKGRGVKIGLVTSGLYNKAWPEILAAFRTLGMGDPLDFYDAIITAGQRLTRGQTGTLGELAPKPHPWLYAETACVGLGMPPSERHKVIGIEDSGAGVLSIRLAGYAAIGIGGGNLEASGARPLLHAYCATLADALPVILGR